MPTSQEKLSSEDYRGKKGGLVFDYVDIKRDGILELNEFLQFPIQLASAGRKELADKVTILFKNYWKLMNQAIGRSDLLSFSKDEWVKAYKVVWNDEWYQNTFIFGLANAFFDSIDQNHDGSISLHEWREYQKKRGMTDETVVKATFGKMDKNGDGVISPEEVKYAYTQFGLSDNQAEDYSFIYDCNSM